MEHSLITHLLVARGVIILSEYSKTLADYNSLTAPVLEYMATHPPDSRPRILAHGRHRIHVLPRDGLVFMTIADETVGAVLAQEMLEETADKFTEVYGKGFDLPNICLPYAMNAFSKTLASFVAKYLEKVALVDPVVNANQEQDRVQDLLVMNIGTINDLYNFVERLLEPGTTLQDLDERTGQMNQTAVEFYRRGVLLRRKCWWRNGRLVIGGLIGMALYVYIGLGIFCGLPGWDHCLPL